MNEIYIKLIGKVKKTEGTLNNNYKNIKRYIIKSEKKNNLINR